MQTVTSLVVQWLSLGVPNTGAPDSVPGQGTRSHMPQLKNPHAATKELLHHNEDWRSHML